MLAAVCVTSAAPAALGRQGGFGALEPPAPAPLPGAPALEHLLLENPWPLAVVGLAGGVAAWVVLRQRGRERGAWTAGGALWVASSAVVTLAWLVETSRERVSAATMALVGRAARAEAEGVGELLAPDAVLFPPGGGGSIGRDAIIARVRDDLGGRWKLREWAVLETQASASGDTARSQVKVRATAEAGGFPTFSWWRIGWRREGGAWRVIAIEPASVSAEVERELR